MDHDVFATHGPCIGPMACHDRSSRDSDLHGNGVGPVYRGFRITASDIGLGIASATLLWGIFWTGDKLSQLMFDFAGRR